MLTNDVAAKAGSDTANAAALDAWSAFLLSRWQDKDADGILQEALHVFFKGRIAVTSSFGADAAVLLHLVANLDRSVPVLFLDTGKHFLETLTYRDILLQRFGFSDARSLTPAPGDLAKQDPTGALWSSNPDACCAMRKTVPLERALGGFDAWITGRKRHQSDGRSELPVVEVVGGRIKINPLAAWSEADVRNAFREFALPAHPLFDDGFASIGCAPCTRRLFEGENLRAGRWSGTTKSECGIHLI
jgi:phosphoadenosine phosphosulfate reductase